MNIITISHNMLNNDIANNINKISILSNDAHVSISFKQVILLTIVSAATINHRLLMLKMIYIKGLVIEHSITQVTYLKL